MVDWSSFNWTPYRTATLVPRFSVSDNSTFFRLLSLAVKSVMITNSRSIRRRRRTKVNTESFFHIITWKVNQREYSFFWYICQRSANLFKQQLQHCRTKRAYVLVKVNYFSLLVTYWQLVGVKKCLICFDKYTWRRISQHIITNWTFIINDSSIFCMDRASSHQRIIKDVTDMDWIHSIFLVSGGIYKPFPLTLVFPDVNDWQNIFRQSWSQAKL